jgi:Bacterial Ig-like domain (group 1)
MKSTLIKIFRLVTATCAAAMLAACGGGTGGTGPDVTPPTTGGTTTTPTAAAIEILSSKLELGTGSADSALITVIVKNASNQVVPDVAVNISSDFGVLIVNEAKTNAKGQATASLSAGASKMNRAINVTATAVGVSSTLRANTAVQITGTKLTISGPSAAGIGSAVTINAKLQDSLGNGLRDTPIAITSNLSANIANKICTPSNCLTDSSGNLTITYTPSVGGNETVKFDALGASAVQSVAIASNVLTITVPDDAGQLPNEYLISSSKTVKLKLLKNNGPFAGEALYLTSTGGSFSPNTVVTDGNGEATATLNINSSVGKRDITAIHLVSGGVSNKLEFFTVSRNPYLLTLNPSPSVIAVNTLNSTTQQSTLTATVRDNTANSNPVKNVVVTFSIANSASQGGRLTTASAVTDADGIATATYIAGTSQSGNAGVTISASMNDYLGATKVTSATLSVTQQALFINLAFGNEVSLIANNTLMKQNFSIVVTDATGNPSNGSNVNVALLPIEYYKGIMYPTTSGWTQVGKITQIELFDTNGASFVPKKYADQASPVTICANEDKNFDSNIQPNEDFNNDGILWPGVVPSVKFLNGASGGLTGVTNVQGYAEFEINIPRNHALWSKYKIVVTTQTASGGAQGVSTTLYKLPILASDVTTTTLTPPNSNSPFGQATVCSDKN